MRWLRSEQSPCHSGTRCRPDADYKHRQFVDRFKEDPPDASYGGEFDYGDDCRRKENAVVPQLNAVLCGLDRGSILD